MTLSKFLSFPPRSSLSNYKTALIYTTTACAVVGGAYYYWKYRRPSTANTRENDKNQDHQNQNLENDEILDKSKTIKNLKDSGNKLFKIGKYDDALSLYSKAIETIIDDNFYSNVNGDDGDNVNVNNEEDKTALEQLYQNRAAVFEKLGDYKSVIIETSKALKLNQKYVKALHRRSKAYQKLGFLDEALEDITAVCILESFASPSSVQLADDVLKELGAKEGHRLMEQRAKEGKGVKPSSHICTSYLRGFYNCPVSKIVNGLDSQEETNQLQKCPYSDAISLLRNHDYDGIIRLTTEQIDSHTLYQTESHYLRGTFRFLYGQGEVDTMSDFQIVVAATDIDRSYKAASLIKMASHYALVDKLDKCNEAFEDSAKLWPDNVDLWHHRGQVFLTQGNLPGALELMTKAADLAPNFAMAVATKWYVQYRVLGGGGDYEGAAQCIREFEGMIRKFDTSPDVFSLYGQILMENNRFAEAELHFARVAQLDKTNAGVMVHRAMAKFQQSNNIAEAIDMLEEAIKIDDRNEFVYETLGTLQLQNGALEPAIYNIEKALSLARSLQELTILSSLRKAAVVQKTVRDTLGLSVAPGFFK